MAAIHCDCPIDQMDKWWIPLKSAGLEVVLFEEAERAIEIGRRLIGAEMWSDKMVREKRGGLVCLDGVWLFVLIPNRVASEARSATLCFGVVKRPRLIELASRQELEVLSKLEALFANVCITRQTWLNRLGRWMFGGSF